MAFILNNTNMELTDDDLEFSQTLSQNEQQEINATVLSTYKEGKVSMELEIPLYIYIIASFINAVIFITGTFGNFLVIVVVIAVRNMRTPTNMFLLNLSAADILVLLVCQPAGLLEFFGKDRWFLGKLMCKLVPLMENGVLHVSILTMVAVTFERYNALCHPLKYRMASTISATVKTIICIWLVGTIMTLPFFVMTEHEDATFYDGSPIKVCRTKVNEMWRYCYMVFVFVAFFVAPFVILVGFYARIIRQLMSDKLRSLTQNDRNAVKTLKSRKQVIRMLIFIIVLFFVSLFPIRVVSLWLMFTPSEDVIQIGLEGYLNIIAWARVLMYLNSAGNPIIYSLTSTKFKVAFKRVLQRQSRFTGVSSTRYSFGRNRNKPSKNITIALSPLNGSRTISDRSKLTAKTSSSSSREKRYSPHDFD